MPFIFICNLIATEWFMFAEITSLEGMWLVLFSATHFQVIFLLPPDVSYPSEHVVVELGQVKLVLGPQQQCMVWESMLHTDFLIRPTTLCRTEKCNSKCHSPLRLDINLYVYSLCFHFIDSYIYHAQVLLSCPTELSMGRFLRGDKDILHVQRRCLGYLEHRFENLGYSYVLKNK